MWWTVDDEMKALWHPLRAEIYKVMMRGPATQSEIAKRTGAHIKKIAHHTKILIKAGCIREVERDRLEDLLDPLYEIAI